MTRKIGRYEILGALASGGMAEILLARLVGPSGFERPVVIKRIRPDLDHDELLSLFLAEARLAAKVRHANVVAVEDLGTDDGAPYLVMEYLEGESLSNVTRRLKARGETMASGIIAYVVSEACAGLHAAHELRDSNGDLLGLVHRDVSPQNVFVTYDGAVKMVDFGIARTGASAMTDPGLVLGKFGYMAPEQLRGEAIDRRTDVFALGIVLYELLTGHRLFKRFNVNATTRAVVSDPIVPPRRFEPAVPPALEAICMRALSRPREDRYATAAEMRRELLVALRELASEEPSAEAAELMVRCFADRISDKRVLLRNVREGSVVDHVPVGDTDVAVDIPGLEELTVTAERVAADPLPLPPRMPTPIAVPVSSPPLASRHRPLATTVPAMWRRSRSKAFWLLPAALLAGATAGGIFVVLGHRATAHPPVPSLRASDLAARSSFASTAAPPPSAEPSAESGPEPSATPAAASSIPPVAVPSGGIRRTRPSATAPPVGRAVHVAPPVTSAPLDAPAAAASASARGFRRFQ